MEGVSYSDPGVCSDGSWRVGMTQDALGMPQEHLDELKRWAQTGSVYLRGPGAPPLLPPSSLPLLSSPLSSPSPRSEFQPVHSSQRG
uniref:Uncharacterized protein n=1 Tax=Knipowitschia caucasica TaxID=637954 RepID=A0AAV2LFC1_KNICA